MLLIDLFGFEQLTYSFGFMIMFEGLGLLLQLVTSEVILKVAFIFFYINPFFIIGLLIVISSIMTFLIPSLQEGQVASV